MTRRHTIAAFSLIEVMISVVVLALGMLGLGAVIPVVVSEQRTATEQVFGTSVLQSAEAYLRGRGALYTPIPIPGFTGPTAPLAAWRDETDNRDGLTFSNEQKWGMWVVPEIDQLTGEIAIPPASVGGNNAIDYAGRIGIEDRLYPVPHTGGLETQTREEPRYVWDFAARRVYEGDPYQQNPSGLRPTDAVQFAVFVRAVDPGIRVPTRPRPYRLSNVIAGGGTINDEDRRPAVAVGSLSPSKGVPVPASTPNANVEYSAPIVVPVERGVRIDPTSSTRARRPDRLTLRVDEAANINLPGNNTLPDAPEIFRLLSQTGQKLVDSLGNIYTVVGVEDAENWIVRIDPPVPSYVDRSDDLVSVVFVPQVPIAVSVLTVEP